jgi:sigma-E factor negative regulatory protein RseC
MDNPTGRIVSLVDRDDGARAVVAVEVAAACPRCAAGKGCGAGLLTGSGSERQVEARIRAGQDLATNDVVELSLAPDNLLRAASIVYGLPMLGASIGTVIAFGLSLGDAAAAVAALLGLACGLAVSRWRLQQESCLSRFVPTVERRV